MDYRKIMIICFFIAGCNEVKDCGLDDNRRLALVEFYRYSNELPIDTLIFDRITSPQSPYLIYPDSDTLLRAMFLPLNPEADATDFLFETDSGVFDLSFSYRREFSVFDVDCDPSVKFFDLSGSSIAFDSVIVINPILNREELTNVEVYF